MSEENARWWEPRRLDVGESRSCRLGPLSLVVRRFENEWQVAFHRFDDQEQEAGSAAVPPEGASIVQRFAAGSAAELELRPLVADRSLVAVPRTPISVLPGERAKIYISSPVWIDVRVGSPSRSLMEIPVKRLSDTWVGSTTLEGEVAYSLKTQAFLDLDHVPSRSHRCVTPILLSNAGEDVLPIESMNLPIPYLSLYSTRDGELWTGAVSLVRSEGGSHAHLEVLSGPPAEAVGADLIGQARLAAEPNLLVRAFASLWQGLEDDDDG